MRKIRAREAYSLQEGSGLVEGGGNSILACRATKEALSIPEGRVPSGLNLSRPEGENGGEGLDDVSQDLGLTKT